MNVLIIEDSKTIATYISTCIKRTFSLWNIDISSDYLSALELANANDYQLIIIDYELDQNNPHTNGLNLGKQLKTMPKYHNIPVIFETSYQEHIFDVVNELNCIYYLVKPFTDIDIIKMLEKINTSIPKSNQLTFTDNQQIKYYLNINDIICVSSNKHQLIIHTSKSSYNCCNYTLISLEEACNNNLIRCHKSYLVNPQYIINVDKQNKIITVTGSKDQTKELLPLGRKYLSNF